VKIRLNGRFKNESGGFITGKGNAKRMVWKKNKYNTGFIFYRAVAGEKPSGH
jgi:hypothetical protein